MTREHVGESLCDDCSTHVDGLCPIEPEHRAGACDRWAPPRGGATPRVAEPPPPWCPEAERPAMVPAAADDSDERERIHRARVGVAEFRLSLLSPDEREVALAALSQVLDRLEVGRERYGVMDLNTITKDLRAEAREELIDGLIYLAADLVRGGRERG